MVRFYDPKNDDDLNRVQTLLDSRGIEYFLRRETETGIASLQILVAEEDLPAAEELLRHGTSLQ